MRRLAALLFVLLSACTAFGQGGSATLTGYVQDSDKAFLPGASVVAINTATNQRFEAKTGKDGGYNIVGLPVGPYRMEVEKPSFKTIVREDMFLHVQDTLQLNFQMAIGSASESVTVEGNSVNINTTDASVSTVVDQNFVKNIPLNGRSFQSLMTAVPGVTAVPVYSVSNGGAGYGGEIVVNGQRSESNYFTVDGVSANVGSQAPVPGQGAGMSGSIGNETASGTTQSIIPLDALEEFRALTSTYSAAYGRASGGSFLFTSRSGTNQVHGDVYDYVRNGALDANNTFNKMTNIARQTEVQNDFGGFFGGPVFIPHIYEQKDKSFFFFAYEGLRLTVPTASTTFEVPTPATQASAIPAMQPILNAYPVFNPTNSTGDYDEGNGLAIIHRAWSLPSQQDNYSLRLDQAVNSRLKLFVRLGRSTSDAQSRVSTIASALTNVHEDSQSATIGAASVLSSKLVNDFRINMTGTHFQRLMYFDGFGGSIPLQISQLPGLDSKSWYLFEILTGLNDNAFMSPSANRARQLNVVDTVTRSWDHHTLQAGIDFRQINNSSSLPPIYEINVANSAANAAAGIPYATYPWAYKQGQSSIKPIYDNFSAYVQDEWKVSKNLTASLGVRWDVNPAPHDGASLGPYTLNEITDLTTASLAPRGTPLWQTRWNNLAPRIGLAYTIHNGTNTATVIRAGAGIFYDTGDALAGQGYMYETGISAKDTAVSTTIPVPATTLANLPGPSTAAPYNAITTGFDPNLRAPYVEEYNLAVEQAFGPKTSFTLGYVGSVGRASVNDTARLPTGTYNFSKGNGVYVLLNNGSSNYNSLQAKVEERLSHGLQLLASYTWSHSIDNDSANFTEYDFTRASSDFDVRNEFQSALTYDAPSNFGNAVARQVLGHWSFDGRVSARSSLPINIIGATLETPLGLEYYAHPYIVPGQPLYLYGAYPGGKKYNYAAFSTTLPAGSTGQTAVRNGYRSFDAVQADLAVRRDFHITERMGLLVRLEGFNVLNHPIYGNIRNTFTSGAALFGLAYNTENQQLGALSPLYQQGGPRSLQVAAKLHF